MHQGTASRGTIFSWTLFDFANTGFYVIIITLVFPRFFTNVIAGGNEAYWGRALSASMLITAILGPLFGSIADASSRKKLFLGLFTGACVAATAGLYLTGAGTLALAVVLIIIANIGFEGGTVFYDALLPEISSEKYYARISGYGFAMGYLGSLVMLGIVLPILSGTPSEATIRSTFLIAAAFFALFSLPLFLNVREQKEGNEQNISIIEGYRRLRQTFSHLRQYRSITRFLLAFFVYNDSILTVILFAGIFADKTLGMSQVELIIFFAIVQLSALVGSLAFAQITNRIGARQVIVITLLIWITVVVWAYFIQSKEAFYVVGAVAGIGLGSSQSTSRALMALLTPYEKKTEFFGFYDGFFGKASAVIGPLIFGEVASAFGQRPAMLVVGGLFLIGILLVLRVPDVRPGEGAKLVVEPA
jgi:UMF1 family MFS transporter